jgi:glycosyltransferase involved in cell wall biosynthesis
MIMEGNGPNDGGAHRERPAVCANFGQIRVLHFARFINRYDFIDFIVSHADRRRFVMMACTLRADSNINPAQYPDRGVPHFVVGEPPVLMYGLTALRLARLLKDHRVDVLHAHHYYEALIGALATRVARRTRLILGRHYSDSIHALESGVKRRALLTLEALANHTARRIVVPSSYVKRILLTQGIQEQKVDLIPYGLDRDKYPTLSSTEVADLRRDLGLGGRLVLGTFGRIDGQKGHSLMLQAIANLRNEFPAILWLVVGEGAARASLEARVRNLGLTPHVHFVGWRRDALRIMRCVDAVVQPTLQEAFSQVMVEALWMERALLISDVGGVADLVRHESDGLVVPRGDRAALEAAVSRLLKDPGLRARLGREGRQQVEDMLAGDRIMPQYAESYARAIAPARA